LDAASGRKGRLLMILSLQLRKGLAEDTCCRCFNGKKNGKSRMLELRPRTAAHGLN